jgi:acyl-CoA thioesterase
MKYWRGVSVKPARRRSMASQGTDGAHPALIVCGARIGSGAAMDFDSDTAVRAAGEGRWDGVVAEGWDTPRGPLGGYIQAIVLSAMTAELGDAERAVRSMTMHFMRVPKAGPVSVAVTVERAGRSLSTISARLEQDGKALGLALAAFSKPWEGPLLGEVAMPEVEPPEGRGIVGREVPAEAPAFIHRLSMQGRFGAPPFSAAGEGLVGGWVGLTQDREIDALAVCVLADAWFPAPWPRLGELAPAPTIDLTIHFRCPLPIPDGLLLGRFTNSHVGDGFFDEDGVLWATDGTLVAQSRQLGLLLGATDPAA